MDKPAGCGCQGAESATRSRLMPEWRKTSACTSKLGACFQPAVCLPFLHEWSEPQDGLTARITGAECVSGYGNNEKKIGLVPAQLQVPYVEVYFDT